MTFDTENRAVVVKGRRSPDQSPQPLSTVLWGGRDPARDPISGLATRGNPARCDRRPHNAWDVALDWGAPACAPRSPGTMTHRLKLLFSLRNSALFAAALLLSVVPIWLTPYLPLVDIPEHAAQVASLHELWNGNSLFTDTFQINWFTPYLLGDLLLYAVSTVLPIVTATKLVVSAALMAVPWLTGLLLREVGGEERLRWLAIPASYSVAFYWGFMAFVVAIPMALAYLLLTVRFERSATPRNAVGIALCSVVLFFGHVIALGIGSLLALTYLLAKNLRSPRRFVVCALPCAVPLPLLALWTARIYATESSVQHAPLAFATLHERLVNLFNQLAGLDQSAFLVSLLVASTVVLAPLVFGYRFSKRPERWLLLVVGAAVYFTFPSYAQGAAVLYQRLGVFLIPLWLLVWDPPAKPRPALGLVVVIALVSWLGVNTVRFFEFGREARSFDTALHNIEPGRRVASLLMCNSSQFFSKPVYWHFPAWYQAVSHGVVDLSFAASYPSMVRYRDANAPRLREGVMLQPKAFSWPQDGGARYDYFLLCAGTDESAAVFKEHRDSVSLLGQYENWWLYKNLEPESSLSLASRQAE